MRSTSTRVAGPERIDDARRRARDRLRAWPSAIAHRPLRIIVSDQARGS
ncbi:hypothetical protein [Amycolatopsis coloradensis]|nr:hypothetical protein [Amycolatopsis coloradensis]